MSEMNTKKILELMGLTAPAKMRALERMESFSQTGEETANEMLNRELFGVPATESVAKKRPDIKLARSIKEAVSKRDDIDAVADDKKEEAKAIFAKKNDDADSDRDYHLNKAGMKTREQEKISAKESDDEAVKSYSAEDSEGIIYADIKKIDDGAVVAHFDYFEEDFSEDKLEELRKAMKELGYEIAPALDSAESDVTKADEAVAAECNVSKDDSAAEMLVETSVDAKFPEAFTFDEEAFGKEYGVDKDTVTCLYVPEDNQANIAEHISVNFDYEGDAIVLNVYADGKVDETVNAEVVEPQFTAEFQKKETEEGVEEDVLVLTLIEENETGDETVVTKSEEDTITESEGDEQHKDENGANTTPEFIEEAGLNLDSFYSKQHGIKPADKGATFAPASMANESLAAKVIRTKTK